MASALNVRSGCILNYLTKDINPAQVCLIKKGAGETCPFAFGMVSTVLYTSLLTPCSHLLRSFQSLHNLRADDSGQNQLMLRTDRTGILVGAAGKAFQIVSQFSLRSSLRRILPTALFGRASIS